MTTSTLRHLLGTPVGLLLVATAAVACGSVAPSAAPSQVASPASGHASSPATSPAHAPAVKTYFSQYGVSTHAYKPRRVNPSVDGSLYLRRVHWTLWNNRRAVGHGIAHVNDCKPYCAAGHYARHAVTVRLTRPRELCGSRFFTAIRLNGSDYHTYSHWSGITCR